MSDPFRRLFLDQVEIIIERDPSRESLLALLRLATPGLDCGVGSTCSETQKLFKNFLLRVHPDKHPQDTPRATRLCQDAQTFYEECISAPPNKKTKHSRSPSNVSSFPLDFNVVNTWPHVQYDHPYVKPELTVVGMSQAVAYQCINARGAIAHGKEIELMFDNDHVSDAQLTKSVDQIFSYTSSFGGAKELRGVDEIKEELMKCGPVVSTSFCPTYTFLSNNTVGQNNQCYQKDILIVGWQQLSSGEVWLVQPLYYDGGLTSQVVHVAVGHFGIDDCCLAPKSDLKDMPWQGGPYYDGNMGGDGWLSWDGVDFAVDSLDSFIKEIGCSNNVVTVRDKSKKAHSRSANLHSVKWDSTKNKFTIAFDFIE